MTETATMTTTTLLFFLAACVGNAQRDTGSSPVDSAAADSGDTAGCDSPLDWYGDADGDGFGTLLYVTTACQQPAGYVYNAADCDDTDAAIKPGATETCDLVDQDCDGTVDDEVADAPLWVSTQRSPSSASAGIA